MAEFRKSLLLSFSALALLSACDDKDSGNSNWADWLTGKSQTASSSILSTTNLTDDTVETQAGNYLAGQFAQYQQDWTVANQYLDKVIALDPGNIDLQQRAMVLAMQAGDDNRAVALARKVLTEDSHNVLALLFIGTDELSQQDYKGAVSSFNAMPKNGIADFIRPILVAWAQTPDGPKDDDALVNTSPLHAYHALLIADYLGKVKDPEHYFINILASGGVDSHILENMAAIFARQGKPDLSKKIYDTLIQQYEQNATIESKLKDLEAKRDNPALANQVRIKSPAEGAAEAFYNMAHILYQDKSDDSALVFARLAAHLDPNSDDTRILMARTMMRNNHIDEAIKFYKAIKKDSPEYLESQREAAELMEQQGKVDDAVVYLNNLYASTKDINALIQIGDTYRRAEKHTQAIEAYNRAVAALGGKVSADYWYLLYARGMSYERNGDMKHSEEDLEQALQYKPDHPYLLNYLGYSWADQGKKLDKAMELVAKAAKLRPDDGYIVDSLGWIYFKTGDYKDAVDQLEKAVEMVPYDATINDHLGDAYWNVGRKQEARFQWQRAINHSKDEKLNATIQDKIDHGLTLNKPSVLEAKKDVPPASSVKR